MGNEWKHLRIAETGEEVTVRLYDNCMEIIDKDGFKTTIIRDTIVNAKMEGETYTNKYNYGSVRVSARVMPGVYVSHSTPLKGTETYTVKKIRIKTSIMDDLVLYGYIPAINKDLETILEYCLARYKKQTESEVNGYYSMLVSCWATSICWIAILFNILSLNDVSFYFVAVTFLSSFISCRLLDKYYDCKPIEKYPRKIIK